VVFQCNMVRDYFNSIILEMWPSTTDACSGGIRKKRFNWMGVIRGVIHVLLVAVLEEMGRRGGRHGLGGGGGWSFSA